MVEPIKRREPRKFKRIFVRFGKDSPQHRVAAIQISTRGMFLATNHNIYPRGSELVIEVETPQGLLLARAVVRHAKRVAPQFERMERPGMGVELTTTPPELRDYLDSL